MAAALLPAVVLATACADDAGVNARRSQQSPTVEPSSPSTVDSTAPTAPIPTDPPIVADTGDGVGDVLFPDLGNPGLDVRHYSVDLEYDHAAAELRGTVGLDIDLISERDEITLDAVGLRVAAVAVDGEQAEFRTEDVELRITLPSGVTADRRMLVEIDYATDAAPRYSPSGWSLGWYPTDDGSFLLVEPDGMRNVMPCNDHPSDKATFTFRLTVPDGMVAVANGELVESLDEAAGDTFVWEQRQPMATYLVLVVTGDYLFVNDVGPGDVPLESVVLRSDRDQLDAALEVTEQQLAYFVELLGAYPLDRYGLAVTDSFGGLAMETQGRSLFSRDDLLGEFPDEELLAHELAHQWFGNAVTLERWSDIWLNESFATYASWMWTEHSGGESVAARAEAVLAGRPPGSTAAPTATTLFAYNSYDGGAVVLHALRGELGDQRFVTLLRRWVADNAGTSQGTDDFIALAEEIAGSDLDDFFEEWLYAEQLPRQFPAGG